MKIKHTQWTQNKWEKIEEPVKVEPKESAGRTEEEESKNKEEEEAVVDEKDTDQDGLTDEEEIILGTKIDDIDSDDDNLFDREEVEVYDTDPLNPDSDGDGFLDGDEVNNNYNPLGSGALYEIK